MKATPALLKKLRYKPGTPALILDPPRGYAAAFSAGTTALGFLQAFVDMPGTLERALGRLLPLAAPGALVWIAYPKQSSGRKAGVNRDIIRLAAASHGWHTVAIVALDDTWSALRLRPDS